jgi:hypothetical protein
LVIAALLAGLVVAPACGGDGDSDGDAEQTASPAAARAFASRYRPLGADLQDLEANIRVDTSVGFLLGDRSLARKFRTDARHLRTLTRQMSALNPPKGLDDQTRKLVGVMKALGNDMGAGARVLTPGGDTSQITSIRDNLATHTAGLIDAREALEKDVREQSRG